MKKRKYCLIFTCLVALILLSACSSKGITGNADEVSISLHSQITPKSAVISKDKGLAVVDPKAVTSLYISSPSNTDLATLKHFVNLKFLRIDNYMKNGNKPIYNLDSLRDLPLVGLYIAGFEPKKPIRIESLEPIGDIEFLATLDLEYCQTRNVDDLASLTGLGALNIKDGKDIKIEDLSPLANLINMGILSEAIESSKEWTYGPYMLSSVDDGPLIGLFISNGNHEDQINEIKQEIIRNRDGISQTPIKEEEPVSKVEENVKNGKSDLQYFNTYSTHKTVKNSDYVDIFLQAFNKESKVIWDYVWKDIRPTELREASEPVGYDGNIYIEVDGKLYCLDGESGKLLWENSRDVGGGTILHPFKGRIYLTSYYGNVLTCLDKDTGAKIWAIEDNDYYWGHAIYSQGDEIIVRYGDERYLLSVNYLDGQIKDKAQGGKSTDDEIDWASARASSILENNHDRYGPMNIIDNKSETAWSEGATGNGIDEWIEIQRDGLVHVSKIVISNGYHVSDDIYNKNARLKRFRLDLSGGEYIYYDASKSKSSDYHIYIHFDRPISTDYIKLTILDVYEGNKYEDTCITEIKAY